jgi:2-polyprenyl-3-methyl-5-hydroxy-6-metoxy-1,4-benzoquinol methylase
MIVDMQAIHKPAAVPARRTNYKSMRRQDRWMAPLLETAIVTRIRAFGRAGGNGRSCLDVGCGGQPLRAQITALGLEYVSVDVAQNAAGNVDYIGAIDGELPETLTARSFDLVVCTEVLEHVPNWPAAFANLARTLKAGGRLLITCPHIWVPHEEPADFFRPTSWALAHHGAKAGLRAVEITRLGDGYDVLGTVLAAVRLHAPEGRPWMWLVAGPAALIRKAVLALLGARWMKHVITLRTGLYLNTVAVFEKPE